MEQDNEIRWRHFVIFVHKKIAEIQDCVDKIHEEVFRQGSDLNSADLWKIEAEAYRISRRIRDLTRMISAINEKQED